MSPTRMIYSKTIHIGNSRMKAHSIPCQPCFRTGFPEASTPRTTPWNDLCDEVLLPLGSLFFVFLAFAIVIWVS